MDTWFRTATELSRETVVLCVRMDVLDEGLDIDLSRVPFGVELRPFTSSRVKFEVRGDAAASEPGGRGLPLIDL